MSQTIEAFMRTAGPEQRSLLSDLSQLAERENRIARRIERARSAMSGGGVYSPDGGFSLTLCETEDDFKIVTYNDRQELKEVRTRMGEYLKRAVNIGMAGLGIVQRHYESYVGEPISKT